MILNNVIDLHACDSKGFDLEMGMRGMGMLPNSSFLPFTFQSIQGLDLQLLELVKYNSCLRGLCAYYITMEAMDPTDSSHFTFQTCVVRVGPVTNGDNRIITEVCRIKPGEFCDEFFSLSFIVSPPNYVGNVLK